MLNAFPYRTAQFGGRIYSAVYGDVFNSATLDAEALRIDHKFGTVFPCLQIQRRPSASVNRVLGSLLQTTIANTKQ
jgi:hypothetical protein